MTYSLGYFGPGPDSRRRGPSPWLVAGAVFAVGFLSGGVVGTWSASPTGHAGGSAAAARGTFQAWEALERAVIGKAVDLLSGPGGLAAFLRRRQPGARLGGPRSLTGDSREVAG